MLKGMRKEQKFEEGQEKDLTNLDKIIKKNDDDDRRLAKLERKRNNERTEDIRK